MRESPAQENLMSSLIYRELCPMTSGDHAGLRRAFDDDRSELSQEPGGRSPPPDGHAERLSTCRGRWGALQVGPMSKIGSAIPQTAPGLARP